MLAAVATLAILAAQGDSISLTQALRNARERRGAVTVAAAVVDASRAQRTAAILPPNPTLQYTNKKSDPRQRLTVDQRLDWLLRWPSERAAGAALVNRSEVESEQRLANVAREVRYAFYGALAARDQYQVSGLQAALADTLSVLAARRLEAGDISVVERDRFALEAARARRLLLTARADYQVALAELARATGSPMLPARAQRLLADQLDTETDTTTVSLDIIPRLQAIRGTPCAPRAC
jgi:outer membrane protein TolC